MCTEGVSNDDNCDKWELGGVNVNAIEAVRRQNKKVAFNYLHGKDIAVITLLCEEAQAIIEALEKQIPKEPELKKFAELMRKQYCHYIECPTCGYRHGLLDFKTDKNRIFKERSEWLHYCYNCGQKMDWGWKNDGN